jgi:hypothetical protein
MPMLGVAALAAGVLVITVIHRDPFDPYIHHPLYPTINP